MRGRSPIAAGAAAIGAPSCAVDSSRPARRISGLACRLGGIDADLRRISDVDASCICTKLRHCVQDAQIPAVFQGFHGYRPPAVFLFCAAATIWLD
jgi:hypothetical protein